MKPQQYFAVHCGEKTGVFDSWAEIKPLVSGYPNAKFKKFTNQADAEQYVKTGNITKQIEQTQIEQKQVEQKPMEENMSYNIYTDGAYSSKTKRCGVGVAFDPPFQACAIAKTLSNNSTHQQAEIDAIVSALWTIKKVIKSQESITIWTDSEYAIKCMTIYVYNWQQNGWVTANLNPVKHRRLIERGVELLAELPHVHLRHISEVGLASHDPYNPNASLLTRKVWAGNKKADQLARGL